MIQLNWQESPEFFGFARKYVELIDEDPKSKDYNICAIAEIDILDIPITGFEEYQGITEIGTYLSPIRNRRDLGLTLYSYVVGPYDENIMIDDLTIQKEKEMGEYTLDSPIILTQGDLENSLTQGIEGHLEKVNGLLRALQNSEATYGVRPVTINFDKVDHVDYMKYLKLIKREIEL